MAREGGKRGWPCSNSAPPSAPRPELPRVRAAPSVRAGLPLPLSSLRTAVRRPFRVQVRAGGGAGRFSRHRRAVRALRATVFSHARRPLRVRLSSLRTPCGGPSLPRRRHGRAQAGFPGKRARALVSCGRPLAQVPAVPRRPRGGSGARLCFSFPMPVRVQGRAGNACQAGRVALTHAAMSAEDDKKARLASALRANLARRKAQGRARAAAPADTGEAAQPQDGAAEAASPADIRIVRDEGAG